jgi:cell division protein FtsB
MRAKQLRQGILIGITILVAVWLLSLIWGLIGKAQIAVNEAHNVQRQYKSLEERKQKLEADLSALATVRGQDAVIRTTFGVARPGEEVIVVVPPASTTPTSTPSWWKRIFSWF